MGRSKEIERDTRGILVGSDLGRRGGMGWVGVKNQEGCVGCVGCCVGCCLLGTWLVFCLHALTLTAYLPSHFEVVLMC